MNALGKQPLSRLALGYNTLGLQVGVLNNESKQEATCRIIETTLFIIGENKFAPSDVWWILQRLCCLKSDSFCGLCHLVHSRAGEHSKRSKSAPDLGIHIEQPQP